MAEVTVFTADRMLAIESGTVVDGTVDGSGHLILTTHGGTPIDAGNVVGPPGSDAAAGSSVAYQTTPPATPMVGDVWVDSDQIITPVSIIEPGIIAMWGGSTAPVGWQICDGSAASTAELVAVVGTNVPDLRGKFVLGVSASHAAGSTGGAETVTLTTAQIPSHTHDLGNHSHGTPAINTGYVSSGHTHNFSTGNTDPYPGYGPRTLLGTAGSNVNFIASVTNPVSHAHSGTTGDVNQNHVHAVPASNTWGPSTNTSGSAGTGGSHENMPPYYALIYIIRSAP